MSINWNNIEKLFAGYDTNAQQARRSIAQNESPLARLHNASARKQDAEPDSFSNNSSASYAVGQALAKPVSSKNLTPVSGNRSLATFSRALEGSTRFTQVS